MLAILSGLFSVRLNFVRPEDGDLKGMGFFIGSIAFPLLIFNTVATANIGAIDWGVIGACSLGKICVLSMTWFLAFVAYMPKRSRGQRILTAAVFAFFSVASDDFAIGFPVIDALYTEEDMDMSIYITGNALVGSFLFVPLTIIGLAIGGALKDTEEGSVKCCRIWSTILYDLIRNPVLVMTCIGLLLKIIVNSTGASWTEKLPHPFSNIIDLFTAPFGMSALFLTGTSLRSPRVAVWAVGLVLMKVVVCAYLSYAFGTLLIPSDNENAQNLRDFTFFYGVIPTGSPPIVFAAQFDPASLELIATAVLFGLIMAGPIMFVTAYSLPEEALHASQILQQVQATTDASSILCGLLFSACLLLLGRGWGFQCPAKLLLAFYGLVLLVYAVVSLMLNPITSPYSCDLFKEMKLATPLVLTFSWLQNTACIMVLLLQSMLAFGTETSKRRPLIGLSMAGICFVFALLPTFLATPNTINEVCEIAKVRGASLVLTFCWSCLQLLIAFALAIHGLCRARRRAKETAQREGSDRLTSPVEENSEGSSSDSENSENETENPWQPLVPQGIILAISILFILKTLTQVINSGQVLFFERRNKGSFAAMLLLESILEHGQLVVCLAPVVPFITERMQSVVELGRTCRERRKVGLKMPLKSMTIMNKNEAWTSDPVKFDVASLFFKNPDFTFFESREFFLSPSSDCDLDLDIRKAANTQQLGHANKVLEQFKAQSGEEIPALEFHMFPEHPLQLNSTWMALIVPKSEELFGKTVYLCRPLTEQNKLTGTVKACVAELTFDRAPLRLFRGWSWAVDPVRSMPHRWLLCWELSLALSALTAMCLGLHLLMRLLWHLQAFRNEKEEVAALERLAQLAQVPKTYKLASHSEVHSEVDGEITETLDASAEVSVLELQCSGKMRGGVLERLVRYVKGIFSSKTPQTLQVLTRQNLSKYWLMLGLGPVPAVLQVFVVIVLSLFSLHVFVVYELLQTLQWGVYCDEILERERQRLKPSDRRTMQTFSAILLVLAVAFLFGFATLKVSDLPSALFSSVAPFVAVLIHSMELKECAIGLSKWREPQLTGEYTEYPGEALPTKTAEESTTLSKKRDTWMMRILVDYSFSEGHLVYLPQATARQNTLLLHESTDSVNFVFERGAHTKNVTLKLEHLQLENQTLSVPLLDEAEGEEMQSMLKYQLNLPQGPLYSRITVEAESRLRIKATQYTFHLVRVGEAIELSLTGEVAKGSERVPFAERRRNAEWYVPELVGNCTLEVKLQSISFAPLGPASEEQDKRRSHLPQYSHGRCLCGNEETAFGNECLKEETFFSAGISAAGSLSGTGLVQWLQDVSLSGKRARLRLEHGGDGDVTSLPKDEVEELTASNASGLNISNEFATTMPSTLLMRGNQLVVGTTQDETDVDKEALPFKVVPHPPPLVLRAATGFLQPHFDLNRIRSEYVLCQVADIGQLNASVSDERFDVETRVTQSGRDCLNEPIVEKRFRAVRKASCDYWESYLPWNGNYDILATLSPHRCLLRAIDLNDRIALNQTMSWLTSGYVRDNGQTCDVLQKAVRLERLDMLDDLAEYFDLDCAGCVETPLGVAAAEGRLQVLKHLLDDEDQDDVDGLRGLNWNMFVGGLPIRAASSEHGNQDANPHQMSQPRHTRNVGRKETSVRVDTPDANNLTALVRAVGHCEVEATQFLLEKGSDVNHLFPPFPGARRLDTFT
eukprot:Skav214504  [mRNA]  locus=scaffold1011:356928:371333:- [translate_table: standard]